MKRYQVVAFLLSTAMTVNSVVPIFGASSDVLGHWAEATITKWQNEGRVGGYEDGTFRPDRTITRAEFVRLLNSAAPTAFTSTTLIQFNDVKESDWYYADVVKAVRGNVASGFEDGTFRPNETITRMQAAVFIYNAKGLTPNEAGADVFTDAASMPSWAKGAVGAAVSAGYMSGYTDGSFGGNKGMTRAEAVSTLDRVLGNRGTNIPQPASNKQENDEKEEARTADAGNMVWTNGGGGGSSKKSSNSSSNDKKTHNITIRSQSDADDYEGKTLTGTTTIYANNGLELNDIKFKGDVDIHVNSDAAVASAYATDDVAVGAAYFEKINIYFEGKTSISGKITIVENNAPSFQVVITTRNPRALGASIIAKAATAIFGFEFSRVEAQAPVEIAEGAKVHTVEVNDEGSVDISESAEGVDKVIVTGDAKDIVLNREGSTDITVQNGASVEKVEVNQNAEANIELKGNAAVSDIAVSDNANAQVVVNDTAKVENVAVSDSANADVIVKDEANVEKVELSDTATAKVDVAPEAKVDEISSTSTGKTEISGEGEIGKIEASDPSTIEKSEEVQTPVDVIDTPTPSPNPDDNKPGEDDNTTNKITANPPEILINTAESFVELTTELEGDIIWSAEDADGKKYRVEKDEKDSKKAKLVIPGYVQKGTIITVTAKSGEETATIEIEVVTNDRSPVVNVVNVNTPTAGKIVKGGSGTFTFELEGENLEFINTKDVIFEVIADGKVIRNPYNSVADTIKGVSCEGIYEKGYIATGVKISLTEDADIEEGKEITVKAISRVDNTKTGEASVVVAAGLEDEEKEALATAVEALENAEGIAIEELPASDRQNQEVIETKIAEAAKQIEGIKDIEGIDVEATITNLPEDGLPAENSTDVEVTFKVTMLGVPAKDESGNEKQIEKTVSVNVLALEEVTSVIVGILQKPIAGQGTTTLSNMLNIGHYEKYRAFESKNEDELETTRWNVLNEESGEFEPFPAGANFESGKSYQADIWLKTQVGYQFVGEEVELDISGHIEGAEVSKASVVGEGEGNMVHILVTFPSTETGPITQEDVSVYPEAYPAAITLYPTEGYSNFASITINNVEDIVVSEGYDIKIEAVGENAAVAKELDAKAEIVEEEGIKKIKVTFTNTTGTATKDKKIQYTVTIPKEMIQPKQGYTQPTEDLSADIGVVVQDRKIVPIIGVDVYNYYDFEKGFRWVQGKPIKEAEKDIYNMEDHIDVIVSNYAYNQEKLGEGADISDWFEGLPEGVNAVVKELKGSTLRVKFTGAPATSTGTKNIVIDKMTISQRYIEGYNEDTVVKLVPNTDAEAIRIIVMPVVKSIGVKSKDGVTGIDLPQIGDTELPTISLIPDNEEYAPYRGGSDTSYGYFLESKNGKIAEWTKESGTGDTVQAGDVYSFIIEFRAGFIDDDTGDCNHYYSLDYENINTFKGAPSGEGITVEKIQEDPDNKNSIPNEMKMQFKVTYTVPENNDANKISSVGITETIALPTAERLPEIGALTAKQGDTDKYTVSATEWAETDGNYTTDITFTAKEGYTFAETITKPVLTGIDESVISEGEAGTDESGNQTWKFTITISSSSDPSTNSQAHISAKRNEKPITTVNDSEDKTETTELSNNGEDKTEATKPSDDEEDKTEATEPSDDGEDKAETVEPSDDEEDKAEIVEPSDDEEDKVEAVEPSDDDENKAETVEPSDDDENK
ncbi:S-layer homology domain-containing protein [Clostridium sp. MD294]|uniref:S-layer homology domain-containing protein n=1 Tax=Clostridium sp. MD294 TaxID=97138 RepID=UPI0002C967ED|nr:S-layer homology domain-containing protein [Clostridium sp. MD294]NDO45642.1 hypothetical protein [Clostridium sp. MD294]USF30702.1 hypothetical protein C820_002145 [Clostridium sp. MD294]